MKSPIIPLLLLLLCAPCPADQGQKRGQNPLRHLPRLQKSRLIRLLYDFKPFLQIAADVNYPQTLNLFFTGSVYRRLKGNPFLGYLFDEGVNFRPTHVCLTVDGADHLKKYTGILNEILVEYNRSLRFSKQAPFSLHLFIVDITPHKSRGLIPSITLEVALRDNRSKKSFFIRFSTGHAGGLFEALQLAVKRIYINLSYLQQQHSHG
jgi:hypothetical protein